MTKKIFTLLLFTFCLGKIFSQSIPKPDVYTLLKDYKIRTLYSVKAITEEKYMASVAMNGTLGLFLLTYSITEHQYKVKRIKIRLGYDIATSCNSYMEIEGEIYNVYLDRYTKNNCYEIRMAKLVNDEFEKPFSLFKDTLAFGKVSPSTFAYSKGAFMIAVEQHKEWDFNVSQINVLEFNSTTLKLMKNYPFKFKSEREIMSLELKAGTDMNILQFSYVSDSSSQMEFYLFNEKETQNFVFDSPEPFNDVSSFSLQDNTYILGCQFNDQKSSFYLNKIDYENKEGKLIDKIEYDISKFAKVSDKQYFFQGESFINGETTYLTFYASYNRNTSVKMEDDSGLSDAIKDIVIVKVENDKFQWVTSIPRGIRFSIYSEIEKMEFTNGEIVIYDHDRDYNYTEAGEFIETTHEKNFFDYIPCKYVVDPSTGEYSRMLIK